MIFLENQMYVGGTIAQKSNKDSLIFTFLYIFLTQKPIIQTVF